MISRRSIIAVVCLAGGLAARAATFTWSAPSGGIWDSPASWSADDPARSNSWPNSTFDTAFIPTIHQPNRPGAVVIWPNQSSGHLATTIAALHIAATNSLWLGTTADQPNALIFNSTSLFAHLTVSNTAANPFDYWQHVLALRFATRHILSNDTLVHVASVPDADDYADYSAIWLTDAAAISGPGALIKTGAGRLIVGGRYADVPYYAAPLFAPAALHINHGVLDIAHSAAIIPPVCLNGTYQTVASTTQYLMGCARQCSPDAINASLIFNGGAYYANYADYLHLTNSGDLLVLAPSFLLISDRDTNDAPVQPRHAVFSGALRGTNVLCLPWGGVAQFTGVIAPGASTTDFSIGALFLTSAAPQRISLGSASQPATLHIELAAPGARPGIDHDVLIIEGHNDIALAQLELTVRTALEHSAATNIVLYSDSPLSGTFNTVTWLPHGTTGTLVYFANAVGITDVLIPEPGLVLLVPLLLPAIRRRRA